MAIVSLGQPGVLCTYDFDSPFAIVSQGVGYWGGSETALEAQPDGSRRRRPQTEADAALGKDGGSEGHLVAARQHAREGLAAGTLRGNGAIATGHLPR